MEDSLISSDNLNVLFWVIFTPFCQDREMVVCDGTRGIHFEEAMQDDLNVMSPFLHLD